MKNQKWDLALEQLQEMGHTIIDDLTQTEIEELQEEALKQGMSTYTEDTDRYYLKVIAE